MIKLLLLVSLCCASENSMINEKLKYSAGFRFLSAGNAELFLELDTLNGEILYKLTSTIESNAFLDNFYLIRDKIESWLSPIDMSLKKINKKIREGNYINNHQAIIQGDSLELTNNIQKLIPGKVYDPISFIYFLRTQNLKIGDSYTFLSYSKKKIQEVKVNLTSYETIQVPAGIFNCIKIEPTSTDTTTLLKLNGQMSVWLSLDSLKIPIKIEQKTNIGTMVMKLKDISQSFN